WLRRVRRARPSAGSCPSASEVLRGNNGSVVVQALLLILRRMEAGRLPQAEGFARGCARVGVPRETFAILETGDHEMDRLPSSIGSQGNWQDDVYLDSWPIPRPRVTAGTECGPAAGETQGAAR